MKPYSSNCWQWALLKLVTWFRYIYSVVVCCRFVVTSGPMCRSMTWVLLCSTTVNTAGPVLTTCCAFHCMSLSTPYHMLLLPDALSWEWCCIPEKLFSGAVKWHFAYVDKFWDMWNYHECKTFQSWLSVCQNGRESTTWFRLTDILHTHKLLTLCGQDYRQRAVLVVPIQY